MKMVVFLCVGLVGVMGAWAQEFVMPQSVEEIPVGPEPEVLPATPDPKVAGIVSEIFNVQRPWQLVNPAAPKSFGDGRSNGTVSENADNPGKPRGFILFALDW